MKRNYAIALAALLIVIVGGVGLWRYRAVAPAPPGSGAPAAPPPAAVANPPAATMAPPSFDAVNVGPDGNAVVAGRAAPGAEVTVLAGGNPVGHGTADANGEFVIMTDRPLPPGPQALTLTERGKEGPPVSSPSSLALVVPPHGTPQPPVAVLLPPSGPARALGGGAARAPRQIALDMVEYDADGRTVLSGRADRATAIDVVVDGHKVGSATADATGDWSSSIAAGIPAGRYRLVLRGYDTDGTAAGEIALELRRPGPGEAGDYLGVVPGNTLWHLADRSYGAGLRYVEIYRANSGEIEDPNRIFPGQLLALPAKP